MDYIFMFATLGLLAYVVVFEFIMPALELRRKNKEWTKKNKRKTRMLCIQCPYCKKYTYYPTRFGHVYNMPQEIPRYCRRFKRELSHMPNCRCISSDNSLAMYEEK